jgi:hypothetical protein
MHCSPKKCVVVIGCGVPVENQRISKRSWFCQIGAEFGNLDIANFAVLFNIYLSMKKFLAFPLFCQLTTKHFVQHVQQWPLLLNSTLQVLHEHSIRVALHLIGSNPFTRCISFKMHIFCII